MGYYVYARAHSETLNQACLRDLRISDSRDDKRRITETNGGLFEDSYRWILENKEFKQWQDSQRHRLLWIRSVPGKGKTMLLCGIIDELTRLYGSAANISFFFLSSYRHTYQQCHRCSEGLDILLVEKTPSLLAHVRSQYEKAGKALFEDINAWSALSTIFRDILKDLSLNHVYLVIDALDECTIGLRPLLDLIVQESSAHPRIKWIVSSRNWPEIIERLDVATQVAPISLELNDSSVSEAVDKFIQHRVDSLARIKKYKENTRGAIYRHLLSNSQGTFLWVALVCQELSKTPRWYTLQKLKQLPPGLITLYSRMIDRIRKSEHAGICKQILGIISTVYRPITLSELTSFIEGPDNDYDNYEALAEIIEICGSFLVLRENTVTFVHQSANDFLLQEAVHEIFPRGIAAKHYEIFTQSLEVMFKTLRRDIFDIKLPGFSIKDVKQRSLNPLSTAEYACVYWVDHLKCSERNKYYGLSLEESGRLNVFLQQKYLHWLEALSILGSISHGIQAMQILEMLIQVCRSLYMELVFTINKKPMFIGQR